MSRQTIAVSARGTTLIMSVQINGIIINIISNNNKKAKEDKKEEEEEEEEEEQPRTAAEN